MTKDINLFDISLVATTRSNQGRKLLQPFLTKPFFIDRHARFAETLSSSVLVWQPLQAFASMFIYKLKLRGFIFGDCGGRSCWVQSVLHILCRVHQSSVLFEDVIWFLSNLIESWKNFHLQSFFVKLQRLAYGIILLLVWMNYKSMWIVIYNRKIAACWSNFHFCR